MAQNVLAHPPSATRDPTLSHVHISGRVATPEGLPIAGAQLIWGHGAVRTPAPGGLFREGAFGTQELAPASDSPFRGVSDTCFHRAPSSRYIRTRGDGTYDLIFTFKSACNHHLDTLHENDVFLYVYKEGFSFERGSGGSRLRIDPPRKGIPGPSLPGR
ncbi:MAG: hypothetical protein DWQ09_13980 [Proteobacteria bacterium]|nr:MAG: hypothetical protein DWQ09_13980 [Pseudomonadota bacterium]QKK10371.1 MAG: hypothetical protein HND59_00850 [Pseudomonadota bacterium]